MPRIIVADDHEWIRQILVDVVRQTLPESSVVETADGLQALKAYRRGCSFLVTNHAMPHMDGMTLIRQVRKQSPHLPIAMVSIHPEAEKDAVEAGANWFIPKEQIMERLPRLLRKYAGLHGLAFDREDEQLSVL